MPSRARQHPIPTQRTWQDSQPQPVVPVPEEKQEPPQDTEEAAGAPTDSGTQLGHSPHPLYPQVRTAASARPTAMDCIHECERERGFPMTPIPHPQWGTHEPSTNPSGHATGQKEQLQGPPSTLSPRGATTAQSASRRKFSEGPRVHSGARGVVGTR